MGAATVAWWRRALAWMGIGLIFAVVSIVALLAWAWRGVAPWGVPVGVATGVVGLLVLWRHPAPVHALARRVLLVGSLLVAALVGTWISIRPPAPASPVGPGKRVAVVGAGSGGVHAAWLLDRSGADVTVFEAAPYVGGHAYAYPFVADDGTVVPIDLGFMFGSPTSYQEMKALLALYGVGRTQTNLSMAGRIDGEMWATGMDGLDPELLRLHDLAEAAYKDERLNLVPFWAWLDWHGFSHDFRRRYLFPMLSVLFITDEGVYDVSARFMLNMLAGPTKWLDYRQDAAAWVVEGGSSAYYAKMTEALGGKIRTMHPVTAVDRRPDGKVDLTFRGPQGYVTDTFDAVVLNVHADVARRLLTDRSVYEDFVLGQVGYDPVEVVVHTERTIFPEGGDLLRHYLFEADGDAWSLHSVPARSQRDGVVVTPEPVITLNPQRSFEGERLRKGWRHHRQDLWHLAMMLKLMPAMQGAGNVWYAGDWVTFIGHGPAMKSGFAASCGIAGREPKADLPTEPCVDVDVKDAVPAYGTQGDRRRMCGEADVFRYIVEVACNGKLGP